MVSSAKEIDTIRVYCPENKERKGRGRGEGEVVGGGGERRGRETKYNNNNYDYYIDGHIYRNLSKSIQSAAGLKRFEA